MHPGSVFKASPAEPLQPVVQIPGRGRGLEIDKFARPIILMGRVKEGLGDPRIVGYEAGWIPQFGRHRETFPGKLEAGHVGADAVVRPTGIEGIWAVEPPRLDLVLVSLTHPANNVEEVLGKSLLILVVVADRLFPGPVLALVAGVVVVDE